MSYEVYISWYRRSKSDSIGIKSICELIKHWKYRSSSRSSFAFSCRSFWWKFQWLRRRKSYSIWKEKRIRWEEQLKSPTWFKLEFRLKIWCKSFSNVFHDDRCEMERIRYGNTRSITLFSITFRRLDATIDEKPSSSTDFSSSLLNIVVEKIFLTFVWAVRCRFDVYSIGYELVIRVWILKLLRTSLQDSSLIVWAYRFASLS